MNQNLKTVKTIHIALCGGVALAYFLMGELHTLTFLKVPEMDGSTFVFLLFPVGAAFLGNLLYKQQLKSASPDATLEEKIGVYQTASIIRWALLEGAAFVLLFIKKELMVFGILVILYMVFLKPSEVQMKRDFDSINN